MKSDGYALQQQTQVAGGPKQVLLFGAAGRDLGPEPWSQWHVHPKTAPSQENEDHTFQKRVGKNAWAKIREDFHKSGSKLCVSFGYDPPPKHLVNIYS